MKIFVSFHKRDDNFAACFTTWLKETFKRDIENIFSTSRPESIESGSSWFREIRNASMNADKIFLLISPDSLHKDWILYEAGMAAASTPEENRKVVPIVFGGVKIDDVGLPLSHYQIFDLTDKESFNALFRPIASDEERDYYEDFISHNNLPGKLCKLSRLLYLRHGSYSSVYQLRNDPRIESKEKEIELSNIGEKRDSDGERKTDKDHILSIPLEAYGLSIASIRLSLMPIRCGRDSTWKAGISFDKEERPKQEINHVFQVHTGSHDGLSSWAICWKEGDCTKYPQINIPATFDFEKWHQINIYLNRGKNTLMAYGVDSGREFTVFTINGRERMWNPTLENAKWLKVKAWVDNETSQSFRIKARYEVDYC